MRRFFGKLRSMFTTNVVQVLLATGQILNVSTTNVHLFLTNQPKEFGQQGAVIIVIALLALTLDKLRYEKQSKNWELMIMNEKLLFHEKLQNFRDDSIERTFNLHASQIAQVAKRVKVWTAFARSDADLAVFMNEIDKEFDPKHVRQLEEEHSKAYQEHKQNVAEYATAMKDAESWSGFFWKLEVAFVAIGTLQNAYGPDIVTAFHAS